MGHRSYFSLGRYVHPNYSLIEQSSFKLRCETVIGIVLCFFIKHVTFLHYLCETTSFTCTYPDVNYHFGFEQKYWRIDGFAYSYSPDEHRVSEAGEKQIRDNLLQTDEQLRVRENDGKPEEPRGREDRTELGMRQDPPAGGQPLFPQVRYLWKRPGRHPHAQSQALPKQAHVHRHDDSREQQAADVRHVLWPPESQLRAQVRAHLHRHRQPSLRHPDRRHLRRHGGSHPSVRHKQLSQRAPTLQRNKQKSAWKDERRVRGEAYRGK